jgi:transcriptional regulator with XRE-family HTH domain
MTSDDVLPSLADRLRLIRFELYGELGIARMAAGLGVPPKTWANWESGIAPSAMIILRLIEITGIHPLWLLDGREPKRLPCSASPLRG